MKDKFCIHELILHVDIGKKPPLGIFFFHVKLETNLFHQHQVFVVFRSLSCIEFRPSLILLELGCIDPEILHDVTVLKHYRVTVDHFRDYHLFLFCLAGHEREAKNSESH
ncbi:MAG: hypothetical protein A4E57_04776 [Syntrophorhabdaceae bacterium PtaU1.Bin034]|nr:MAG: hypothetical protein A4E57_04776 [Syntrophorhabdaceae bacterium PtaU1.Bin034]